MVLFLKLFDLADAHELCLVASESLTHRQLVLVLFFDSFTTFDGSIAHCELVSTRSQCCSTIL